MKRVAILGGGPAGAFAAEKLASAGLGVVLIDEKLAWEKPCGGGLTHKAYSQYPFLIENSTPKRLVTETVLAAPKAGEVTLNLGDPLLIYSRFDLNRMLLERAERAGAQIEKTRVTEMNAHGPRLAIAHHRAATLDADFCIVATGARNPLRDVGTQLTPPDTMSALGYYVPGDQARIDIQFLPDLEGYIWIFPRCGHLSVGICGKGEPAQFAAQAPGSLHGGARHHLEGRAILQPPAALARHQVLEAEPRGRRWLDGGGRCRRPGGSDHRRRSLLRHPLGRPGRAEPAGRRAVRQENAARNTAGCCAAISPPIWSSARGWPSASSWDASCSAPCPQRMVEFTRRSPRFAGVMQDLFAGKQPYLGLKRRLLRNLNGSLYEIAMSFGFSRVVPKAG